MFVYYKIHSGTLSSTYGLPERLHPAGTSYAQHDDRGPLVMPILNAPTPLLRYMRARTPQRLL